MVTHFQMEIVSCIVVTQETITCDTLDMVAEVAEVAEVADMEVEKGIHTIPHELPKSKRCLRASERMQLQYNVFLLEDGQIQENFLMICQATKVEA